METRPCTKEEFDALSKDLQEVLEKHNAQMSVKSHIELTKVIEHGDKPETPKID